MEFATFLGPLLGAIAAYAAIRADLAAIRVRLDHQQERIRDAHDRLDRMGRS
jgi:flagellin-like hook-associated protein FlgL